MAVTKQMKYILIVIVLAIIPGIVCAQNADFSLRGRYNASSSGDMVLPGFQTVNYEGYLRLANSDGSSPLTNVTVTFLADNITKIDDSAYAQWTRSSAHWVYPANFTITTTAKVIDWSTDTNPTIDVPVTFSRTLNQTTFSQNGYQLVQCNVTFWDTTGVTIIWGEIDNYKRDKVNVTILNDTFTTDLPNSKIMWQNDKQYQFSMQNMSDIIIGHPYTFSIVLKIDRIDPTKTVTYKPLCGINLITTIAQKNVIGTSQTITIPVSELPPYVHQASASVNEMVNGSYWSHSEKSALLLESSEQSVLQNNRFKIGVYQNGLWYLDNNGNGVFDAGDSICSFGGAPSYTPVIGDWNATGTSYIGVTNGQQWYLDWNGNGVFDGADKAYSFGAPGWLNVTGDWNGDGETDIGVTNGQQWYLDRNNNGIFDGGDSVYSFGAPGWTPVIGKWNPAVLGTKIGVYKDGIWYLDWNGNGIWDGGDKVYSFGAPGWTPIVGEWSSPGTSYIGVTNGQQWYLDWNGNGVFDGADKAYSFGAPGWIPIVGDWNATGFKYIGVTNGQIWYLDWNGNGVFDGADKAYSFGAAGWTPIVEKWS